MLVDQNLESQQRMVLDAFEGYNRTLRVCDTRRRSDARVLQLRGLDHLIDAVPLEEASADLRETLEQLRGIRRRELEALHEAREAPAETPYIEVVVNQHRTTEIILPVKWGDLTRDEACLMDRLYLLAEEALDADGHEVREGSFGGYICLGVKSTDLNKFDISGRLTRGVPEEFNGRVLYLRVANNFGMRLDDEVWSEATSGYASAERSVGEAVGEGEGVARSEAGIRPEAEPESPRESVEVRVTQSMLNYGHCRFSKDVRGFFPGYREPFELEVPGGGDTIGTHVASARAGTATGDPEGGQHFSGMKGFYRDSGVQAGDTLVVERTGDRAYKIAVKGAAE